MAGKNRQSARDLEAALREAPYRFDFFQALRRIEALHPDRPRLGTATKPSDEPIRLGQDVELSFESATLTSFVPATESGAPKLSGRFFGCFGNNGPLPLHLTEYARDRKRNHGDSTLVAFADVFHHRMMCLFYRAWADTEPVVHFDRGEDDKFSFYMASLIGLATEGLQQRDAVSDLTKLHFAGFLSCQAHHADGLQSIVAEYFLVGVSIEEFVGHWLPIEGRDLTRLGQRPEACLLGQSVVLGSRVWDCQSKFRIVLGPLGFPSYLSMLPGGESLERLVSLVRSYIGDELSWDVQLILRKEEVPPLKLDNSVQLGWTAWLGERRTDEDAADLMLNPFWGAL